MPQTPHDDDDDDGKVIIHGGSPHVGVGPANEDDEGIDNGEAESDDDNNFHVSSDPLDRPYGPRGHWGGQGPQGPMGPMACVFVNLQV